MFSYTSIAEYKSYSLLRLLEELFSFSLHLPIYIYHDKVCQRNSLHVLIYEYCRLQELFFAW